MSVLHSDHSHTVQLLQTQVDHSANELARWQNETQNTLNTSAASAGNRSPSGGPHMLEEDVLEVIREPQWEERGTGEVSKVVMLHRRYLFLRINCCTVLFKLHNIHCTYTC